VVAVKAAEDPLEKPLDILKATSGQATWLIALKKESLFENEITQLFDESKKIKNKSLRCLIITFAQLEDPVRLKALQERMWIWNESELKTLSAMFDKSCIIQ